MEVVPLPSRSRFSLRDHPHQLNASDDDEEIIVNYNSNNNSESESVEEDSEIQSMAGKGIMRFCSELLELKRVSVEEFYQSLFSNYSAFVSTFQEVKGIKKELLQLKKHFSIHKQLVEGLSVHCDINFLPKDAFEYNMEDHNRTLFKAHVGNVCEILNVLLSEKMIDEALNILVSEAKILEDMQAQESLTLDEITCYSSLLLEKRAKIVNHLKLVAENPRVSPAELLQNLIRIHRAGDSHLATHLLFQYYHSRIVSGIHELQYVKSANGAYINAAAKFAFSMIFQAAKSFSVLNGEHSINFQDLVQWAYEETKVFSACFIKYIQSISDINDGMITVLEALQSALSYCSLLEAERLLLNSCLVKNIRPCLEDFLQNHINHFKILISMFTSTDTWVVGRYLISGVLGKECSSVASEEQPEYCSLTSSGWKVVMVLQAIAGYVVPLLAIQLEDHILRSLMDLYTEYITLLECALSFKSNNSGKINPEINLAETPEQQVSLLANISSLSFLLSSIVMTTFNSIAHLIFEADNIIQFIHKSPDQLRSRLCQKFISNVIDRSGGRLTAETWVCEKSRSDQLDNMMPSLFFQGLYFELRKLVKLPEDNFVEVDWLMEFMRELMIALFISIINNEELWKSIAEELAVNHSSNLNQFVLDMQFLVEITKHGGYFCNNIMSASLSVLSHMEAVFSAGLDSQRATYDEQWATKVAKEALKRLQEITETESPPNETLDNFEMHIGDSDSFFECNTSPKLDAIFPQSLGGDSFGEKLEDGENEIEFVTTNNAEEQIGHVKSLLEQLCLSDDEETYGALSEEDETRIPPNVSELLTY